MPAQALHYLDSVYRASRSRGRLGMSLGRIHMEAVTLQVLAQGPECGARAFRSIRRASHITFRHAALARGWAVAVGPRSLMFRATLPFPARGS